VGKMKFHYFGPAWKNPWLPLEKSTIPLHDRKKSFRPSCMGWYYFHTTITLDACCERHGRTFTLLQDRSFRS